MHGKRGTVCVYLNSPAFLGKQRAEKIDQLLFVNVAHLQRLIHLADKLALFVKYDM